MTSASLIDDAREIVRSGRRDQLLDGAIADEVAQGRINRAADIKFSMGVMTRAATVPLSFRCDMCDRAVVYVAIE
jgi:hypothetical protein